METTCTEFSPGNQILLSYFPLMESTFYLQIHRHFILLQLHFTQNVALSELASHHISILRATSTTRDGQILQFQT